MPLGDPNREGSLAARFVSRGATVSSSCSAASLSALLLRLLAMMPRNSDARFRSSPVEGRTRLILDIVPSRNLEILNRAFRQAGEEGDGADGMSFSGVASNLRGNIGAVPPRPSPSSFQDSSIRIIGHGVCSSLVHFSDALSR